jgi:hypothetical protein
VVTDGSEVDTVGWREFFNGPLSVDKQRTNHFIFLNTWSDAPTITTELGMRMDRCSRVGGQAGAALVDARSIESERDGSCWRATAPVEGYRLGRPTMVLHHRAAAHVVKARKAKAGLFLFALPLWCSGAFFPGDDVESLGAFASSHTSGPM